MRPDIVLTGPAVGLENIQRLRSFEFPTDFYAKHFFLAPFPTLVPKHKFKSGEALTITTTMGSNNTFYARKAQGLTGKPKKHESMPKMGIPEEYEMTDAEIGRAVPPPYSKLIGSWMLDIIQKESQPCLK